jgi:hypothetical protein
MSTQTPKSKATTTKKVAVKGQKVSNMIPVAQKVKLESDVAKKCANTEIERPLAKKEFEPTSAEIALLSALRRDKILNRIVKVLITTRNSKFINGTLKAGLLASALINVTAFLGKRL